MEDAKRLKQAYLITAHSKKAQLINLLGLLDDPQNDLYLHIDKKAEGFPEGELRKAAPHSRMYFVPRLDARWGSETFIDAILSLIRLAARRSTRLSPALRRRSAAQDAGGDPRVF